MATQIKIQKAKSVRKTIGILDFFSEERESTLVMDISRALNIPQSSASEALGALVEMGVLFRDPMTKSYSPTARLASLGIAPQPQAIKDGRLFNLMDEVSRRTKAAVGIFGICGLDAQLYQICKTGLDKQENERFQNLRSGNKIALYPSEIGIALLSALEPEQSDKLLWRMCSEAKTDGKFDYADACKRVSHFRAKPWVTGNAGLGNNLQATVTLLPNTFGNKPIAIAVIHEFLHFKQSMLRAKFENALNRAICSHGETTGAGH